MSTLLTALLLGFGFAVLVFTFRWISRLLALRRAGAEPAKVGEAGETAESGEVDPAAPEPPPAVVMIQGANFGLALGVLSCLLFPVVPPMMLVLSAAAAGYCVRALWQGLWRYRILVYRALAGLVLSFASVGLHYLTLTEQPPGLRQLPSRISRYVGGD